MQVHARKCREAADIRKPAHLLKPIASRCPPGNRRLQVVIVTMRMVPARTTRAKRLQKSASIRICANAQQHARGEPGARARFPFSWQTPRKGYEAMGRSAGAWHLRRRRAIAAEAPTAELRL